MFIDRNPITLNMVFDYLRFDRKLLPIEQDKKKLCELEIDYWKLGLGLARADSLMTENAQLIDEMLLTIPNVDPQSI